MNDQDVREMLSRRAAGATVDPDAWERIAERIAEDRPESTVLPLAPRQRRFNSPMILGAVAAALLLLVAAVAIVQDREPVQKLRTADDPSTAPTPAPPPTTTPPVPGPNPVPPPAPPPVPSFATRAEGAARQWAEAMTTRNRDMAWEVLAEPSRQAVGGRSQFNAKFPEIASRWGDWAAAPDIYYRIVSLMATGPGDLPAELPRLGVAILSGSSSDRGTKAFRTMSLPVRGTADKAYVDPLIDMTIELEQRDGAQISPRNRFGAYAPSSAKVWFLLSDYEPAFPDDSEGADGDQQHATWSLPVPIEPGQHPFTVVALTVDGRVASASATYTVG